MMMVVGVKVGIKRARSARPDLTRSRARSTLQLTAMVDGRQRQPPRTGRAGWWRECCATLGSPFALHIFAQARLG